MYLEREARFPTFFARAISPNQTGIAHMIPRDAAQRALADSVTVNNARIGITYGCERGFGQNGCFLGQADGLLPCGNFIAALFAGGPRSGRCRNR